MRKKALAVILSLCIVVTCVLPLASASGDVIFTGINDNVLPLSDSTIVKYFEGRYYVPYSVFSSEDLGVFFAKSDSGNIILLYGKTKSLTFNVGNGVTYDQDNQQYDSSAVFSGGMIYLPVDLVCSFFNFTYAFLTSSPAPVLRIKSSAAIFNDNTFLGINKVKMLSYYNAYTGNSSEETPKPEQTPNANAAPSKENAGSDSETFYSGTTEYLCLYDITSGYAGKILDTLGASDVRCCFFVTAGEIENNADLIRHIICSGNSIGIWLTVGTATEYERASSLLYETAKVRTFIVSAYGNAASASEKMAADNGLIYWNLTKNYPAKSDITVNAVTVNLSTSAGSRDSILFACSKSNSAILPDIIQYMKQKKYRIRKVSETSTPIVSIS